MCAGCQQSLTARLTQMDKAVKESWATQASLWTRMSSRVKIDCIYRVIINAEKFLKSSTSTTCSRVLTSPSENVCFPGWTLVVIEWAVRFCFHLPVWRRLQRIGPRSFPPLRENSIREAGACSGGNSCTHNKFLFCRKAHRYSCSGRDSYPVDTP